MATPVPRAIKRRIPGAHVTWLVEEKAQDILLGNPDIDEVMVFPRARLRELRRRRAYGRLAIEGFRFIRTLRAHRFSVAFDLQGLLRSGVLTWLSGAKHRVGFADARECSTLFLTHRVQPQSPYVRAGGRSLDALRLLDILPDSFDLTVPVATDDDQAAVRILESAGVGRGCRIATLCPATTRPNKHWTEEGFAALIDGLYRRYGLTSVLLGGPGDEPLLRRIEALAEVPPVLLAGRTSLKQASAVIRRSELLVSVDTGLLRVGLAMRTPTIALFGPTNPKHLEGEPITVINKRFPCAPCSRHPICGDRDCMYAITPGEVLEAAEMWLRQPLEQVG